MAKEPDTLKWVEELLPRGFTRKPMFGGFAYYFGEKIVLALFESTGDRSYKNKHYNYDLWNGCLFPTDRNKHSDITKAFPVLNPHPVLSKWMYLPVESENFDTFAENILNEIRKRNPLFGTIPNSKKSKIINRAAEKLEKIDTRKPRMFSDEPAEEKLMKVKKISDLKNLGPATEKLFHKAGIKTVQQFVKLGWKKTLVKLVKSDQRNRHSMFTYAIIGALKNKDWNQISELEKQEAREFTQSLKPKKKK